MGVYSDGDKVDRNVLRDDVLGGVFADCKHDKIRALFPVFDAQRNEFGDDVGTVWKRR